MATKYVDSTELLAMLEEEGIEVDGFDLSGLQESIACVTSCEEANDVVERSALSAAKDLVHDLQIALDTARRLTAEAKAKL